MKNACLIGIDIGTSGAKIIASDLAGNVISSHTEEYPLYTPKAGWAEQDPEDWWQAVCRGTRSVMADVPGMEVIGISFSGQMHGLVALDRSMRVIRPSILWCDQRTEKQCSDLIASVGGVDGLVAYTNNTMLTGYTGGKLLWLRDEEPENYEAMVVFVCPKDYIRYRITGEIGLDVSDASGTGFFDTKNRVWCDALINKAGLRRDIFPDAHESTELAGKVTVKAAAETGLPEGAQVFFGGGDAVIQTTGAGLIKPGILGVVIGTSGNVSMGLDRYFDNPGGKLQMFCNNEPGLWHAFGCTLTAGGAYRWYRDALDEHALEEAKRTGTSVYDIMNAQAASSVPGANGVLFAPYLTGERCPYPDANARGVFYGLTLGTTRADITRAVMEGVTYSLRQVVDLMRSFTQCECVYASGGGAASPLWRQMMADIFDLPVYTMSAADVGG
ncbi:MAG: xylulokinase, partial [Clostridia bacterium]|nr:xylulokinase [Clostridia bacterium]